MWHTVKEFFISDWAVLIKDVRTLEITQRARSLSSSHGYLLQLLHFEDLKTFSLSTLKCYPPAWFRHVVIFLLRLRCWFHCCWWRIKWFIVSRSISISGANPVVMSVFLLAHHLERTTYGLFRISHADSIFARSDLPHVSMRKIATGCYGMILDPRLDVGYI